MTELERVEIEDFKGLEYVEFEPTNVNLITGRNNTGKTSFLEAIDLLFNPANLTDFGDNLDSVIHVDSKRSEIRGKTGESELETVLRKPSPEEAEKYFSEAVPILSGHRSGLSRFRETEDNERDESGSIEETIEKLGKVSDRKLDALLTQGQLPNLREKILVLSTASRDYPCFLENRKATIIEEILKEVEQELGQEIGIESIEIYHGDSPIGRLKLDSGVINVGFPSENSFLQQPENSDSATYLRSVNLTQGIEQTDDEQDPIKIDDIGDFLKEKEVVDNLKTFTLDYLVFEEDGEKHQIPYDFMGDGFKSIVGLLWELMDEDVENDIVLLEEPENHMHPGYVREMVYFLIDLARKEDVQLFITTHDSDFINDFFTENLTEEEETYLEEEFTLLRMEEDEAVVQDYETARENLKDLHLDLRGI